MIQTSSGHLDGAAGGRHRYAIAFVFWITSKFLIPIVTPEGSQILAILAVASGILTFVKTAVCSVKSACPAIHSVHLSIIRCDPYIYAGIEFWCIWHALLSLRFRAKATAVGRQFLDLVNASPSLWKMHVVRSTVRRFVMHVWLGTFRKNLAAQHACRRWGLAQVSGSTLRIWHYSSPLCHSDWCCIYSGLCSPISFLISKIHWCSTLLCLPFQR